MDQSELFGRVLKVNVARANKMGEKAMAIWDTDRDAYQNALDADREGFSFYFCSILYFSCDGETV